MLEYKFPKLREEADTIKQMQPDQVGRLKDIVAYRMKTLLSLCDDYFDNLIESHCDICAKTGYAYFDLPPEWGWISTGHLLCTDCIEKWTKKFGEPPELNRKGEIVYEHEFSKDSPHRGQADFGFVFG